jgi:hypothetical protein
LLYPRLDALDRRGGFILIPGAKLYIDKRLSSRLGAVQEHKAIDYRTNKVELPPGASHTDFFDLGALLDWTSEKEEGGYEWARKERAVPEDFHPVLTFTDSYGNDIHCDEHGPHSGPYRYPHQREMLAKRRYRCHRKRRPSPWP